MLEQITTGLLLAYILGMVLLVLGLAAECCDLGFNIIRGTDFLAITLWPLLLPGIFAIIVFVVCGAVAIMRWLL